MHGESSAQKKRISLLPILIRFAFETLFPSLLILKVRSYVLKASFSKDSWVQKQAAQCSKVAIILLIPSIFALYGAKNIINSFQAHSHYNTEKPLLLIKKKQVKKAIQAFVQPVTEPQFKGVAHDIALLFLIPAVISLYIRFQNDILTQTKKLEKVLINNGFARDGRIGLAVFLPIGIVIDVTGHNPKDLVYNNAIWYALNIQIDERDWIERPDKRSVVLFKRSFTLAPEYIFE